MEGTEETIELEFRCVGAALGSLVLVQRVRVSQRVRALKTELAALLPTRPPPAPETLHLIFAGRVLHDEDSLHDVIPAAVVLLSVLLCTELS